MYPLLSQDKAAFNDILEEAKSQSLRYLNNQETYSPGKLIPDKPLNELPLNGVGAIQALKFFESHYADEIAATSGSRYFGFVTGGSTPASVAGDWLVGAYDQNACGSNDSVAPLIERQTIHFLKQMFGLDLSYFGSFVTGATMSNFVGLAIAREWIGQQSGVDVAHDGVGSLPVNILSATPHSSVPKSMAMLGLGRKALRKVPTLPYREAIDIEALEIHLKESTHPVVVVANAGTVNTVDFDDLQAIGKLRKKYNFWMHVDAAFGGFAALSEKFKHLMDGINYADSITIDAHKWLNVPYDSAMQFTRHKNLQLKVFQNSAAYLGDPEKSSDFFHYTPENSRRWRALPSWFTLVAYGKQGHQEIVERNCECACQLGEKIKASVEFKLLAPVKMNVVCFTINRSEIDFTMIQEFLQAVRDDGRVFFTPTVYKNTPAIRAAISNWQTEAKDVELAFSVLKEIFTKYFATR